MEILNSSIENVPDTPIERIKRISHFAKAKTSTKEANKQPQTIEPPSTKEKQQKIQFWRLPASKEIAYQPAYLQETDIGALSDLDLLDIAQPSEEEMCKLYKGLDEIVAQRKRENQLIDAGHEGSQRTDENNVEEEIEWYNDISEDDEPETESFGNPIKSNVNESNEKTVKIKTVQQTDY